MLYLHTYYALFTCRKIVVALRHTKGPRIDVTAGAYGLILTRRIPCGLFSGGP
jgi:hypothetical protein